MDTPDFSDRLIYTVPAELGEPRELLAMREWRLVKDKDTERLTLTSLNGEQVWDGPALLSAWSPDEPSGPSTGVHGLKPEHRSYFVRDGWFYGRQTWAWGWVALSGLVEEYPLGYRAERAAIRQLRLGPRTLAYFQAKGDARDVVAELEGRYQCPVKIGCPEWRFSRLRVRRASR